ncbi:MAG: cytochrome P450 [Halobacteriaceae archaeon]
MTQPPGPTGDPVFGSSRRYARNPFTFLTTLERAYGGVSRFDMGPIETVVVTDPTLIESVLVTDAARYEKPTLGGAALDDLLGEGLLLSEGETWERQRTLLAPAYGMDRLAGLADRITGHAEAMVEAWAAGDTIDIERVMTHVTLDVILDVMLDVDLSDDRVAEIQDALVPVGARFEPDPRRFAVPDWVPLPGDRRFRRAVDTLDDVVADILDRRRGSVDADDTDVAALLLRAMDRGEVPPDQVRDELVTVLLAGHDTTALTLSYTWVLLSEHPDVRDRVTAEVEAVLDGDRPTMAAVQELEYVEWVLREAMRLYPPVYTLFRTPTTPVDLGGYTVDPAANVMLPQWAVHRSDRYWTAPETFDPDRFSPERRGDRPRFAYFPFGGGPRRCIGSHLAMLEATLIVATVAREYTLEYEGSMPLSLQPSITAHPREELAMTVHPR